MFLKICYFCRVLSLGANFSLSMDNVYSTRQNKVSRLLQKETSDLFLRTYRGEFQGCLVTVTKVRVTSDLMLAKIYISVFPSDKGTGILALLKEQMVQIRYQLGAKIKNSVRAIPELAFYLDDSLDYTDRIDQLLKK